jgi:predicted porin
MMIRGFMKTTSLTALVAAAGMLMGGSAYAPANAADLGGDCCADLEARVAELEATTARKGNRVVSLTVYGQVNKALLFWDNDFDSDTYVVDNDASSSRFGFRGTATMRPGWTAGYNMEFDLQADANSNRIGEDDDEGGGSELRVRKNELYIESEQLGRVTLGQGSTAGDGIAGIVLGNSYSDVSVAAGESLFINTPHLLGEVAGDLGTGRADRIRYDSPSIYGFILSTSWGEDDFFDVALRYKKEWNSIRLAAGIQYANSEEGDDIGDFEQVVGSISIQHIPTGIYGAFAAGNREYGDEDVAHDADLESSFWYVQLGLERRFFASGSTTIYAEYGEYEDFIHGDPVGDEVVDRWGFGVVQSIDSAAMDLYAKGIFWDISDEIADEGELTTILAGAIIRF